MNSIYDTARYRFATAGLDWTQIPLILLAYSGTPLFVPEDQTVAAIDGRGQTLRIADSQAILSKAVSPEGYLQTGNVVFETIPIGYPITHFVMSMSATLPLLFIDDAVDLPFEPNGLDVVITPDWLEQRGWGRL
jgi:hypothetical protein